MPSVKQVQVTFDCADPRAVAEFWKAVLGYVDPPTPPGFDSWEAFDASLPVQRQGSTSVCQDLEGVGPRLFFQRVPEAKTVKNRVHLDVRVGVGLTGDERVSALEAEATRLEQLGARRLCLLPADEENESCLLMQDVEGNEFCLD
ncbi:MAG: VOC family protein [Actinomycetota bacterium]|nr:VOC family protein [Actinomycetota bacterium]